MCKGRGNVLVGRGITQDINNARPFFSWLCSKIIRVVVKD